MICNATFTNKTGINKFFQGMLKKYYHHASLNGSCSILFNNILFLLQTTSITLNHMLRKEGQITVIQYVVNKEGKIFKKIQE